MLLESEGPGAAAEPAWHHLGVPGPGSPVRGTGHSCSCAVFWMAWLLRDSHMCSSASPSAAPGLVLQVTGTSPHHCQHSACAGAPPKPCAVLAFPNVALPNMSSQIPKEKPCARPQHPVCIYSGPLWLNTQHSVFVAALTTLLPQLCLSLRALGHHTTAPQHSPEIGTHRASPGRGLAQHHPCGQPFILILKQHGSGEECHRVAAEGCRASSLPPGYVSTSIALD